MKYGVIVERTPGVLLFIQVKEEVEKVSGTFFVALPGSIYIILWDSLLREHYLKQSVSRSIELYDTSRVIYVDDSSIVNRPDGMARGIHERELVRLYKLYKRLDMV